MNDLEICKRIAEIERISEDGLGEFKPNKNTSGLYRLRGLSQEVDHYNPLTDDALCFQLMVKYRVSLFSHPSELYSVTNYAHNQTLARDENPNRAICLAIIEAHRDE